MDARADDRPTRVLVADDEPSMRLLLSINLGLSGFEVVEAESGSTALELAASEALDLALLDVMMPDLSGHEVARRLASDDATADLPVVFISARASREDLRSGYELGAVDYITKPFDPIEVGARLHTVLDRVRSGEADEFRRARLHELR